MRGDATLFTRDDEFEAQWRIIDPVLNARESCPTHRLRTPPGSNGAGGGRPHPAARPPLARDL